MNDERLLKLWDLTPADSPFLAGASRTIPHRSNFDTSLVCSNLQLGSSVQTGNETPNTSGITSRVNELACQNCCSVNTSSANWCTECGTAIVLKYSQSTDTEVEQQSVNQDHTVRWSLVSDICEQPKQYVTKTIIPGDISEHKTKDGVKTSEDIHPSRHTTTNSSVPESPLHSVPKYHRHWAKSSSLYMWRKPRVTTTLQHSSNSFTTGTECENLHTTIPPLDLSSLNTSWPTKPNSNIGLTSGAPNLLSLPNEVLIMILSHLKHHDLSSVMRTNQRLYAVATDPALWRSIVLNLRHQEHFTLLYLSVVAKRKPQKFILEHCSTSISLRQLQGFFSQLSISLKSLAISNCYLQIPHSGDVIVGAALLHCPLISSMTVSWTHLSNRGLDFISEHCVRLEELSLEEVPEVTAIGLNTVIRQHSKWLTKLTLKGRLGFSVSNSLKRCGKLLSNVQTFGASYSKCDIDDIEAIRTLVSLQSLELDVVILTEHAAQHLVTLDQLRSLDITSMAHVDQECLRHISTMNKLRLLCVCPITESGIELIRGGHLQRRSQTEANTNNEKLYQVTFEV